MGSLPSQVVGLIGPFHLISSIKVISQIVLV
jgi:hypothetical protein